MDLAHGAAFYPACEVAAVPLEKMREADVVVVAAGLGAPTRAGLDLLRDNARMATEVGQMLRAALAVWVVMVSNPVDVLTRVLQAASGLPPERVIGTGTCWTPPGCGRSLAGSCGWRRIPTSRCWGSMAIRRCPCGRARLGGRPLRSFRSGDAAAEPTLAQQMPRAAYEVIQRKGRHQPRHRPVTTRVRALPAAGRTQHPDGEPGADRRLRAAGRGALSPPSSIERRRRAGGAGSRDGRAGAGRAGGVGSAAGAGARVAQLSSARCSSAQASASRSGQMPGGVHAVQPRSGQAGVGGGAGRSGHTATRGSPHRAWAAVVTQPVGPQRICRALVAGEKAAMRVPRCVRAG